MKVYDVMAALGEARASDEVEVSVCLTLDEVVKYGEKVDDGIYCIKLRVDDICDTTISTSF